MLVWFLKFPGNAGNANRHPQPSLASKFPMNAHLSIRPPKEAHSGDRKTPSSGQSVQLQDRRPQAALAQAFGEMMNSSPRAVQQRMQAERIGHSPTMQPQAQAPVAQRIWIETGEQLYSWHALRDGVRWFYNERDDTMQFRIESIPKSQARDVTEFYQKLQGKPLPYEAWMQLMSERFTVQDKDDPIHEDPEYLVDEESNVKVEVLRKITAALREAGIQVFLGGAGAGALLTSTRSIKDLDLRIDGQARDIFNGKKYVGFLENSILKPLLSTGLKVEDVKCVAVTTVRMMVDDIEVSITSEPSGERTMSRGETVSGVESLGEIDFLLDKAAAAGDRTDIGKFVTDVYDIIRISRSMPGGGRGILNGLKSMRPKSDLKSLMVKLTQLSNAAGGRQYKNDFPAAAKTLAGMLGVKVGELPALLAPLIEDLGAQSDVEVV